MADLVGQSLGQYYVIDLLAKGGMATVYRARQSSMSRDVAIKVLPRQFTHDETFLERFYREVEVIAGLQHPHILPVYDFGEFDEMPYIVMAYLGGGTLSDLIHQGPMNPNDVVNIVKQMADALDYAHSKGIIHRDFKPSNVLMDERGNCYLADFGLAKITDTQSHITGTAILGTPTYMAPEQAGHSPLGPPADVYALGVTMFQMLAGRAPYEAPTPVGVLIAHASQPVPDIRAFRTDLPPATQGVINKAMAKSVEERYPTPGALATALAFALRTSTQESRGIALEGRGGLIMTNMLGQVIFLDHPCLNLLKRHHSEARTIMGRPLYEVLGMDSGGVEKLIKDIGKSGSVSNLHLEIQDATGKRFPVSFSAVATRDDKGAFVGADITLQALTGPLQSSPDSTQFNTRDAQLDTAAGSFLLNYFVAQLENLHTLAVGLGGKKLGANLEKIVSETAQRNVWPVKMQNGQVSVEATATNPDIYRALLAKAIIYAVSLVGKRVVVRGFESLDNQLDPRSRELANELRIRQLFEDIN